MPTPESMKDDPFYREYQRDILERGRKFLASIPVLQSPLEAMLRRGDDRRGTVTYSLPTPTMEQRLAMWSDDPDEARRLRTQEILITSEADVIGKENEWHLDELERQAR